MQRQLFRCVACASQPAHRGMPRSRSTSAASSQTAVNSSADQWTATPPRSDLGLTATSLPERLLPVLALLALVIGDAVPFLFRNMFVPVRLLPNDAQL